MNKLTCLHCGLVNFATESVCKRCGDTLAKFGQFHANRHVIANYVDHETLRREVESKQKTIYSVGIALSCLLSFLAATKGASTELSIAFFLGVFICGVFATWLTGKRLEHKITKGKGLPERRMTVEEKGSLVLSSVIAAILVFNFNYGYIFSTLILISSYGVIYFDGRKSK